MLVPSGAVEIGALFMAGDPRLKGVGEDHLLPSGLVEALVASRPVGSSKSASKRRRPGIPQGGMGQGC